MTPFGKLLRQERKDRKMLLGDLADRLKISAPYLSQIETGARPIKENLVDKIVRELGLGISEASNLRNAAAESKSEFNIQLFGNASSADRVLASQLAGGFARMSPAAKERLRELMKEEGHG